MQPGSATALSCCQALIPLDLCANAAAVIRRFIGADDARPETWYTNTQDIYDATLSPRPAHGPCGMVQLYHHATLWALRQHPAIHACFADVYGTERLYVTCDRAHFKPPQSAAHPAWSDAGPVHSGLHWDVDVKNTPVPFSVQGVVYLEDTMAETGALRVVPSCRGRLATVDDSEAVAVEGPAGSLVLFCGIRPMAWGMACTAVDGRGVNTVAFGDEARSGSRLRAFRPMSPCSPWMPRRSLAIGLRTPRCRWPTRARLRTTRTRGDPACRATHASTAGAAACRCSTKIRASRSSTRAPPGEEDGEQFGGLTPLGRRLVGLDEWPSA